MQVPQAFQRRTYSKGIVLLQGKGQTFKCLDHPIDASIIIST